MSKIKDARINNEIEEGYIEQEWKSRLPEEFKFIFEEHVEGFPPFHSEWARLKNLITELDEAIAHANNEPESFRLSSLDFIPGIISSIDNLALRKEKLQKLIDQFKK
jgi:hypothetical protein